MISNCVHVQTLVVYLLPWALLLIGASVWVCLDGLLMYNWGLINKKERFKKLLLSFLICPIVPLFFIVVCCLPTYILEKYENN